MQISIHTPAPVAEPRGAALAAEAAMVLRRVGRGLAAFGRATWQTLEEIGRERAERELRNRGHATVALEVARVRAMADRYDRTDPQFAADLRAAASRHETMHGIV
jgi:hypothetical protein